MMKTLQKLFLLSQKEKEITEKISADPLNFLIEKLNSEPDIFHEVLPLLIAERESLFEQSFKERKLLIG